MVNSVFEAMQKNMVAALDEVAKTGTPKSAAEIVKQAADKTVKSGAGTQEATETMAKYFGEDNLSVLDNGDGIIKPEEAKLMAAIFDARQGNIRPEITGSRTDVSDLNTAVQKLAEKYRNGTQGTDQEKREAKTGEVAPQYQAINGLESDKIKVLGTSGLPVDAPQGKIPQRLQELLGAVDLKIGPEGVGATKMGVSEAELNIATKLESARAEHEARSPISLSLATLNGAENAGKQTGSAHR